MTGVFLQVRLDSSRLPRKALLPLSGRTVIEHAMTALKAVTASVHAMVTDRDSASALRPFAEACGFETFIGPKHDVLERYARAIQHFDVDTVVRATGDNPLVSAPLAAMIEAEHHAHEADYSGYDGPPLGTGVEILDAEAILIARREAVRSYDREHVSPYLYTNPERFHIRRIDAPAVYRLPEARVTLDHEADYALLRNIYHDLYRGEPIDVIDLISWLQEHLGDRECRSSA